jgi:hypothetical protein
MQAIVTPLLRWTGISILTLPFTLTAASAQQPERYTISGGDVEI